MHILTKRGNLDNIITYEHICDTIEDMAFIEQKYITLGSTCVVIQGDGGGMEVYMADSNKKWHDIMVTGGGADPLEGLDFLKIKSCTPNSNKYFKLYIDDEGSLIVRKGDNWFDVDYYDGEELLHTEEIWTSGQNATWNETPAAREDEYFTYTFLGWATDESPETVNANAQNNITSDRNLHAVWGKTGKPVTVYFYESSTNSPTYTLETQNGTSLYDAIADMSWKDQIEALYDITGIDLSDYTYVEDIDGTLIYDNNMSSIMSSEEGQTALRNTIIMGNTVYKMRLMPV